MRSVLRRLNLLLMLLLLPYAYALASPPPVSQPLNLLQRHAPAQVAQQDSDIRDIKGPVALPDNTRFLIPAAAILAGIILATLLVWYLRKRRQPQAPTPSPDAVALSELDQARALMTEQMSLVYAERVSDILRRYIEARFQIRSTRQTTQEFFARLKDGTTIAEVDIKNHAGDLQTCLEQCDIAKFAHGIPNNDDMMRMEAAARNFIETTRRCEAPNSNQKPPTVSPD